MSCSFDHGGCRKTMEKNEIFHWKMGQNSKFLDASKESLEHVQYKFKMKKYDFLQKNVFLEIFHFFPFDVKIVKKIFSNFHIFKKTRLKTLSVSKTTSKRLDSKKL